MHVRAGPIAALSKPAEFMHFHAGADTGTRTQAEKKTRLEQFNFYRSGIRRIQTNLLRPAA
jgi:hypothetical protein